MTFAVDARQFRSSVRRLIKDSLAKAFEPDLKATAEELLDLSKLAPIPFDEGKLANAGQVIPSNKPGEVLFGFNLIYAAFQDSSYIQAAFRIVVPRVKKILYIPISRRGKSHVYGANPANEGLVRNVDYVLRMKVRIPIKPYGSGMGPNAYFAGTLKRQSGNAVENLGRRVFRRLGGSRGVGAVVFRSSGSRSARSAA